MSHLRSGVFMLVAAMTIAAQANAAEGVLPASVRACALEKDDVRRLACYDREIAQVREVGRSQSAAAGETATKTASETKTAAGTAPAPEAKFGYRGPIARQELDQEAAKNKVDRVEATIVELSSGPHGEFVLTLDNGQVWAQKTADSKIRVKVGDRVAIKKASFGSFLLVAPSNRTTHVSRER